MTTPNRLAIFALLILSLAFGSCRNPFCPKMVDESVQEIKNNTPIELLQNLERAYKERNIDIYKTLLSPHFRFELISSEVGLIGIDVNGDGINDSWWGYDEEVEFTNNLFKHGSSDGLYPPPDDLLLRLQIPPESDWEKDPEVGHEDWIVIGCLFDLSLVYHASNTSINASGVARFYLEPIGDRWYISIWRDESYL
ncbi:MAG: hypothetical protein ACOYIS_01470 [Candidatus Cloacimonadaceae bacterium]|jgi:hypothetical protein